MNTKTQTMEVIGVPEIARRAGVCAATVRRKLAAWQIKADYILINGQRKYSVYLQGRFEELRTVINEMPPKEAK